MSVLDFLEIEQFVPIVARHRSFLPQQVERTNARIRLTQAPRRASRPNNRASLNEGAPIPGIDRLLSILGQLE